MPRSALASAGPSTVAENCVTKTQSKPGRQETMRQKVPKFSSHLLITPSPYGRKRSTRIPSRISHAGKTRSYWRVNTETSCPRRISSFASSATCISIPPIEGANRLHRKAIRIRVPQRSSTIRHRTVQHSSWQSSPLPKPMASECIFSCSLGKGVRSPIRTAVRLQILPAHIVASGSGLLRAQSSRTHMVFISVAARAATTAHYQPEHRLGPLNTRPCSPHVTLRASLQEKLLAEEVVTSPGHRQFGLSPMILQCPTTPAFCATPTLLALLLTASKLGAPTDLRRFVIATARPDIANASGGRPPRGARNNRPSLPVGACTRVSAWTRHEDTPSL